MADVRELLLRIRGKDDGASRALDAVGKAADETEGDLQRMNIGLVKLDSEIAKTTDTIKLLKGEIARTGDVELFKDLDKQVSRLRTLNRRRGLLGDDRDAAQEGARFGAKLAGGIASGLVKAGGLVTGALGEVGGKLPPQAQAAIGAAVVAAAGSAAPAVGAVIAGAVIGGVGLGGVAGGLAIAARHPAVRTSARETGQTLAEVFEDAGRSFVPATLDALAVVRSDVRDLGDDFERIFAKSAQFVAPLTRGVTGFVRNLLPGVERVIDNAGPVVDEIASWGPKLGDALGDVLTDLSDEAPEAARALHFLWLAFETGIRVTGKTIEGLTNLAGFLDKFSAALNGDVRRFFEVGVAQRRASQESDNYGESLLRLFDTLGKTGQVTEEVWTRQVVLTKSLSDGIEQAGGFAQALDLLNGGALDLRAAERAVEDAIDAVTESIKENGKSLDARNEQGRTNAAVLDDLARKEQERAQRVYESTLATKGQIAAENAALSVYQQGRDQLIKSAQQFGLSRAAAERYADSVMRIPAYWGTKVEVTGHQAAIERANAIERALRRLTNRTIRIGVVGGRGGNLEGMSEGGPVYGPGPKGVDSVPRLLAPGEHVLDVGDVRAMGGHGAVEAWRDSLHNPADDARWVRASLRPTGGTHTGGGTQRIEVVIRWPDGTMAGRIVAAGLGDPRGMAGLLAGIRGAGGNHRVLGVGGSW